MTAGLGPRHNKLHSIESINPKLGDWFPAYRDFRRDEVINCGSRVDHALLTHYSLSVI